MTALALAIGFPGTAASTVYKWVDENGMTHYTTDPDQVPGRLRLRRSTPGAARSVDSPPELRESELYSIPGPRTLPDETPVPERDQIGTAPPVEALPGTSPLQSAPASTPMAAAPSASDAPAAPGPASVPSQPSATPLPRAGGEPGGLPTAPSAELEQTARVEPAADPTPVVQARPRDPPPLIESSGDPPEDPRIAELEAEIDRERDVLKELLSGSGEDGDWLRNPELRGVAERLSRLQHELNAVRTHEGL